jgi:hypothetical protein
MPETTSHLDPRRRVEFVQREIVPRRNEVGDLVRDFTAASANALHEAEGGLADMQREAANRLRLTLALSLVIAVVVVGFSLRHSGGLTRVSAQKVFASACVLDSERGSQDASLIYGIGGMEMP